MLNTSYANILATIYTTMPKPVIIYKCERCGRESKNKAVIDNCKHTRRTETTAPSKNVLPITNNDTVPTTDVVTTKDVVPTTDVSHEPAIPASIEPVVLVSNGRSIRRIYHCSDIHIRLQNYHDEYRIVFTNFYEMLRKECDPTTDLIVCCGDILHNKNDLSPECIILAREFLETLATIAPFVFIAGNHDAVLSNADKVDSLSAILHNDTPKGYGMYYLSRTGVYQYNNLYFGVSSLLDNGFVRASQILMEKDDKATYRVALYHGSVGSPVNDTGFKLSGERHLREFEGYDAVLLGDIHKYQYLDEKKTVAYSSSLISQNYGECDEYHGYLRWDFGGECVRSEYRIVENPYRYMRWFMGNRSADYLANTEQLYADIEANRIPHHAHIQLCIHRQSELVSTEYAETVRKIKSALRMRFPTLRPVYVYDDAYTVVVGGGDGEEEDNSRRSIVANRQEMMRQYLQTTFAPQSITDDDIAWIVSSLTDIWDAENTRQTQRPWTVVYMEWNNMYRYGENNVFDFRRIQEEGVAGIIAPNSAGKSTLIDILAFILFGQTTRSTLRKHVNPDIIHIQQKKCKGRVFLQMEGDGIYIIERDCVRLPKENGVRMNVCFYRLEDSSVGTSTYRPFGKRTFTQISLTGKDRFETDKLIGTYIGTFEDFTYHCVYLQFDTMDFTAMPPKERKDLMYRIFGLEHYTKQYPHARDQSKKYGVLVDSARKRLENVDIQHVKQVLEETGEACRISEAEYAELQTQRTLLETERENLWKEYDNTLERHRLFKTPADILETIVSEGCAKYGDDIEEQRSRLSEQIQRLNDECIPIHDFNIDLYHRLEAEVFPDDLDERCATARVLKDYVPVRSLQQTMDAYESALRLKEQLSHEQTVYEEQSRTFPAIESQYNTCRELSHKIALYEKYECDVEYNPECHVCMKHPKVVMMKKYAEELSHLRTRLEECMGDATYLEIEASYTQGKHASQTWGEHNLKSMDVEKRLAILLEEQRNTLLYNQVGGNFQTLLHTVQRRDTRDRLRGLYRQYEAYQRIQTEKQVAMATMSALTDIWDAKRILANARCMRRVYILRQQSDETSQRMDVLRTTMASLYKKRGEYQATYDKYVSDTAEYNDNVEMRRRWGFMEQTLGMNGFTLYMLRSKLDIISEEMTQMISAFIPLTFKFAIDGMNDIVLYTYRETASADTQSAKLDTFGGMETLLKSLLLRVLSVKLSEYPMKQFIVLDETFVSFDAQNLGFVKNIFTYITRIYRSVLFITHIDKLKDHLSQRICIKVGNTYSELRWD